MEKHTNICPECDGSMSAFYEKQEKVTAPFGIGKSYVEKISTCTECGYEISDDPEGTGYRALYEKSVAESIPAILEKLRKSGYSMVAVERILELPFRTLSRWKTCGKPSAGGTALLRLLATFPWLLEVSDNNYDNTFAETLLMMEANKVLHEKLYQNKIAYCGEIVISGTDSMTITANFNQVQPVASIPPANNLNLICEDHAEYAATATI